MWFVILALLIVAAYFVYDALRDRRLAESGNSLSTTRRVPLNDNATTNAPSGANAGSSNQDQSQTIVNPQTAAGTTGPTGGQTKTAAAGIAAGAVTGAAVAAGVGSAVAATEHREASGGKLQFLDAPIGQKDDLTRIDGIGPVIETELNNLGIYHYHQIGNFSDSDVHAVNGELDFPGRIERENWIQQARKLMTDTSNTAGGQSSAPGATGNTAGASSGLMSSTHDSTDATPVSGSTTATVVGSAGAIAAGSALAGTAANAAHTDHDSDDDDDDDLVITDADLTGAWNTDLMVEIQERLKVLNTRESDAPRLRISREDYRAIKEDDDERFSREQLQQILERLREL